MTVAFLCEHGEFPRDGLLGLTAPHMHDVGRVAFIPRTCSDVVNRLSREHDFISPFCACWAVLSRRLADRLGETKRLRLFVAALHRKEPRETSQEWINGAIEMVSSTQDERCAAASCFESYVRSEKLISTACGPLTANRRARCASCADALMEEGISHWCAILRGIRHVVSSLRRRMERALSFEGLRGPPCGDTRGCLWSGPDRDCAYRDGGRRLGGVSGLSGDAEIIFARWSMEERVECRSQTSRALCSAAGVAMPGNACHLLP